ncbi:MAG: VanZ family protein [Chitinophagaceae bacterium]
MHLHNWQRNAIALGYFLFITILFFLPGSAFPDNDWLDKIWFDKWVHIGIFALLILIWLWTFDFLRGEIVMFLLFAAVYGLIVEIMQHQFIPNRSFDIGDWAADIAGSLIGLAVYNRYIKK